MKKFSNIINEGLFGGSKHKEPMIDKTFGEIEPGTTIYYKNFALPDKIYEYKFVRIDNHGNWGYIVHKVDGIDGQLQYHGDINKIIALVCDDKAIVKGFSSYDELISQTKGKNHAWMYTLDKHYFDKVKIS